MHPVDLFLALILCGLAILSAYAAGLGSGAESWMALGFSVALLIGALLVLA
jgi:hypothetical protein